MGRGSVDGKKWGDVTCLRMCVNDRAWPWEWRLRGAVTVGRGDTVGKAALSLLLCGLFLVQGELNAVFLEQ